MNEEAKLLTTNQRYNRALETLEMLKEVPAESRSEFIKDYNNAKIDLSKALLFGKAEACINIAYIHKEGLDGKKSDHDYKLFLLIGSNLGNEACKKQLSTVQNINDAEKWEAKIWTGFINTNANKKKPDEEITTKDIADICVRLEATLSDNTVKLETFYNHFNFMKSEQTKVTQNNHIPHSAANSNHHNDEVNLGGQTDFPNTNTKHVKEHCEIS